MSLEDNQKGGVFARPPLQGHAPVSASALEEAAWQALKRAHSPYSGFPVGAALETEAGEIVVGCNSENASLSLGICAERVAVFGALARGQKPGKRMVVVTQSGDPTPPCGGCREVLRELCPHLRVTSVSASGSRKQWHVTELLPAPCPHNAAGRSDPRVWIAAKRDGRSLRCEEIRAIVRGLLRGEVEPYQMTAFMMAVFWKGMTRRETRDLTAAMLDTGARLDLSGIPGARIDKHSSGGVGDKVSIPLVPLAMAAGLRVPMISGRGLGHTGGTLDKLDSIPGYRTVLPIERLRELAHDPGGFIAGQTGELVPADRIMYALRDVSATIESIPLIVSSILSKKLAAGLTGLVLDVKFGRGAFMPDREKAELLARTLVEVAGDLGLPAVALMTRMDEPIGEAVGNALEVRESMRLLTDSSPAQDLRELTVGLGGLMTALAGVTRTMGEGAELIERKRRAGEGADCSARWIAAQGGDAGIVADPDRLPVSTTRRVIRVRAEGVVHSVDALLAGRLCMQLGGGRHRVGDPIDGRVGLLLHRKRGDHVEPGDALFTLFLPEGASAGTPIAGEDEIFQIGAGPIGSASLITALVTTRGVFEDPWNVPLGDE